MHSQTPEERAAHVDNLRKIAGHNPQNKPRELDLLAKALSESADEVVMIWLGIARNATKAVVVGNGKDAYVQMVPDDDLRLKAINLLYDRIHGKPGQAIKLSGEVAVPAAQPPRSEDRAREVAEILARQGALPHTGRRRRAPAKANGGTVRQG